MRKNVILVGGFVVLAVVGLSVGLLMTGLLDESKEKMGSLRTGSSIDHSGPNNLSEARIQDLTSSSNVNVSVVGADFQPNNIQIKKDTKVIWTNTDDEEHLIMEENIVTESHDSVSKNDAGGSTLKSPKLDKNKMYAYTFTGLGQVYYHCSIHPNIKGKVTIIE